MKLTDITDIFDFSIAGYSKPSMYVNSYYMRVKEGHKNLSWKIYLMSPEDYLKNSFAITDILKEELRELRENILPATKWALPVLDIYNKKGLGRGRALVCYKKDIKEIPVFVVYKDISPEVYFKERKIKFKLCD